MSARELRSCWQNCGGADDPNLLADSELAAIDAMEDAIAPLNEATVEIRRLITLFEACYHEADREAEFIIGAMGAGQCPPRSNERPAQRRRELEKARAILAMWGEDPAAARMAIDVGGVPAEALAGFLGDPTPLKQWQGARGGDGMGGAPGPP